MVCDATDGLSDLLAKSRHRIIGFDPTASSLHVGNL
jgi:tyrosyl-tRNA synthetase